MTHAGRALLSSMGGMRVGLTGGIGAGKSTVARLFQARGARIVDGDQVARQILAPGTPGLAQVDEAFPGVVVDGELDRAALAARVFGDGDELARLEAITHPLILETIWAEMGGGDEEDVTVVDLPLLVEKGWHGMFDVVVVVGAPDELRRERLRRDRGMSDEDISARMAAQASDAQRRAVADYWIDNSGTPADVEEQVERVWWEIRRAAAAPGGC